MEELIEIIKKRQEDDEAMPFMYNDKIISLAESMLEKEKEVMCEFAFRFNHDAFTENYIKAEFEETFSDIDFYSFAKENGIESLETMLKEKIQGLTPGN